MRVLLHLLICTALRAHTVVVEALYKMNYLSLLRNVKDVEWSIVVCLLMQLVGFHYALDSVYILSTLLFLYSALLAHVRFKRLINSPLHYITYPVSWRTTCERKLLIFLQDAYPGTDWQTSSNTLAVMWMATGWEKPTKQARKTVCNGASMWSSVVPRITTSAASCASFRT